MSELLAGMSVKSLGFAEPDAGRPARGLGGSLHASRGQEEEEGKKEQLLISEV